MATYDTNVLLRNSKAPAQKKPVGLNQPGATVGNLAGSARNYSTVYGGIPEVADPRATQADAFRGNLANFGNLENLTGKVNDLNFGQYTGRLPGYGDMASASSSNILSNLRGEIPDDIKYLIGQSAAERGISRGVPGSDFSNSEYLRSLGLTSLDLRNQGEQQFSGAVNRVGNVPLFDPSNLLVTPGTQQQAQEGANVLTSAPVPQAAKRAEQEAGLAPFRNQQIEDAKKRYMEERERLVNSGRYQPGGLVGSR